MKTNSKVLGFASTAFCLLLLFVAAPSFAQCGPGGAGCEGCIGSCTGLACAVPGQHTPSPGACTPAQTAAGGWEISTTSSCGGSLAGVCQCYLPSFYQITQENCARVYFSSIPWEKEEVLASSEYKMVPCGASEALMTPATATPTEAVDVVESKTEATS